MAEVKKLVPFILIHEGGFVDDPDDLGGATNKGITIGTYATYCKRKGYPAPTVERLKMMTQDTWTEIMKSMYWDRWKADKIINQSVANILVDWVWASGVNGIKRPQQLLGVKPDGLVGPQTLASVNAKDAEALFYAIKADRIRFIDEICAKRPANLKFKRGWLNRINDFKFEKA
jgi:lysozyme family protein